MRAKKANVAQRAANNRPEDINRTGMDRDTERQREKKREEGAMKRVVGNK